MHAPITTAEEFRNLFKAAYDSRPKAVLLQGDADDFEWSMEVSADAGASWTPCKDGAGISTFTGCQPMQFWDCHDVIYRVKVSNMGTATSINVREN